MASSTSDVNLFIQQRFPESEPIQRLALNRLTDTQVKKLAERIHGQGRLGEETAVLILAHAILRDADLFEGASLAPLDALFFTPDFCESLATDYEEKSAEMLESMKSAFADAPILIHGEAGKAACLYAHQPVIREAFDILKNPPRSGILARLAPGEIRDEYLLSHISGEAFTSNPFPWHPRIDPKAGAARLLFGSGTRLAAPMREDYSRLIALGEPGLRPESTENERRRFAQSRAHVFSRNLGYEISLPLSIWSKLFTGQVFTKLFFDDEDWIRLIQDEESPPSPSLNPILDQTALITDLRRILETIESMFGQAMIIDFNAHFDNPPRFRFHLLRCRFDDLVSPGSDKTPRIDPPERDCLFQARDLVLGRECSKRIERVIYVIPSAYAALNEQSRFSVARLIGRLMRDTKQGPPPKTLLLGPGRWGTTTPSLGVPASLVEIDDAIALGEIAAMHAGLIPELSMGTHFLQSLVDIGIPWFGLRFNSDGNVFSEEPLLSSPNRLLEQRADARRLAEVVHVVDFPNPSESRSLRLYLNPREGRAIGYFSAAD